jgi:hypothetical protein
MKKIGNRLMLNMQQVSELKVNGPEWALHKLPQAGSAQPNHVAFQHTKADGFRVT